MGTEEVLLIRHVTCGHKQQRRRAEENFSYLRFGCLRADFLLDDRC